MRRGRPPKPASERLSVVIRHRLSKQEHRKLCAAAKRAGLSVSEYVRRKLAESYEVKK
jgi:predicted HicB family RNase H-like nuclease